MAEKRYKLSELKLGMQVKLSELSSILDVRMILINTKIINNNDLVGTLVFFGDNAEEYQQWFEQPGAITPVYFNSEELREDVSCDW